ncbi:MAG: hypothetical protein KDA36_01590 [Planctomycetaceae bacterium]|nr:hypothetical protein [Planctomycetaceae bacterium]
MSRERNYPREVDDLLTNLRRGIRQYVLLRGLGGVLSVCCLAVWGTFLLDWGYFQLERADLPRGVRAAILVATVSGICVALFQFVLSRLWREFSPRSLAAVLERTFPELDSRLLTIVELVNDPGTSQGLSKEMYERTTLELRQTMADLPWKNVFDWRPFRKTLTRMFLLMLATAGLATVAPAEMKLWVRRDVFLQHAPWPRQTRYQLSARVPPQERPMEFHDGTLFHPRGGDLSLLIQIEEGAVVPNRIEFRSKETVSGIRNRGYFTRQGENRFLYTLTGISQDLTFQIRAGDAEREWYRVVLVDPPRIDRMEYLPKYPDYTRLNREETAREPQPVLDSTLELPLGTKLTLNAICNKPMTRVSIATERFEVEIDQKVASISYFDAETSGSRGERIPIPNGEKWLSEKGRRFQLPLVMSRPGVTKSAELNAIDIAGTEMLKISLEDDHGIQTGQPIRLTLMGIEDESPRVVTMLSGIGSSITRKAMIPIRGKITDDYGVEAAYFEYQIDGKQEEKRSDLKQPPTGEQEHLIAREPNQSWEVFDALPLDLKIGQKLGVGITALDGDTLSGPHRTTGERYQFEVVTDEALLSILHGRELNLRQRFEQIMAELKRLRGDLQTVSTKPGEDPQDEIHRKGIVSRNLLGLRKNHNESMSVEQGFEEIRRETLNNRIETTQSLERLENKLIRPLHSLNETDYNEVDQDLGELQVKLETGTAIEESLPRITGRIDQMLAKMESILKEMRRLETYGELVEMLKSIKLEQEELKRLTERERKRQAIEGLK